MDHEINPVDRLIQDAYPLYGVWKDLAEEVGYARASWAKKQLDDAMSADAVDCADNSRYCRVGNEAEEALFAEIAGYGCCGTSEWEAVDPDGYVWRFGFNYGH